MWKHSSRTDVKFTFKVLKKHKKPLQRQIHEAVNINRNNKESLNSLKEFIYYNPIRLTLEQMTLNPYDCKSCFIWVCPIC